MANSYAHAPYEDADPRVLAVQNPFTWREPAKKDDWPVIYEHCESSIAGMRTWRYSWWQHWAIVAQYGLPYRYHWVIAANTMNRGFPVNESIINETAVIASRTCAAGLLAGLMSASSPWIQLGPLKESYPVDYEGQDWLDATSEDVLAVLSSSNWYTTGAQMFRDVADFGQGPVIIYEDKKEITRTYLPCAGEYFLRSGARGTTETVAREFTYTVQQIVDFWQLENCPEEVKLLWQQGGGSLDREFVIGHIIEPNFGLMDRRIQGRLVTVVPPRFPYREIYWIRGKQGTRELSRKGFPEKPFMVPGCYKTSNDPYYRSFGMDALGGNRQLQQEERRKGEYIDKFVRPPMGADVSLENKPSSILSGEITYMNVGDSGKQQMFPIFEVNPAGFAPLTEDIKRVEERIKELYFNKLFMLLEQMEGVQPRNQLEILERKGEKIQQIGPLVQIFQQETAIGLNRVMGIMARRGLIRPKPASLRGIPLGITFTGILAMLLRASETASMERMFAIGGSLGEASIAAGLPSPLRVLNLEESYRYYGRRIRFPEKLMYTPEQVAEHDKARTQQQQEQQLAGMALPAAQAAGQLSKTDVGGGVNAVQALLGTGPSQGPQR